jgi:hypothetical protein
MDLLFILILFALVGFGAMYASTAFSIVVALTLAPVAFALIVGAVMLLVSAFQRR